MSMGNPHAVLRSYRTDGTIAATKLAEGTLRRILGYASPYRLLVFGFLVTLVLDALLVVAQPLLFRRIIDPGVTPGDSQVVTTARSAPNAVQAPTAHQCTAASSRKCSVRKAPRTPTASPPHMAVPATVASRLDTSTCTLPQRADIGTAAPCCASGGEASSCRPFA